MYFWSYHSHQRAEHNHVCSVEWRTSMQEVVRVQLPQGSMPMLRHKVAQEEVDGVLLLCISVRIAVEATDGGHEIPGLSCCLPVPSLPLEEGGMGFRPAILHRQADTQLRDRSACLPGKMLGKQNLLLT